MKRLRFAAMVFGVGLGFVVVGMLIFHVASQYLNNEQARKDCAQTGQHRYVTILNDRIMPTHTDAQRCDILTITNDDAQERLMAFGPHEHHISYDGVSERLLGEGQSLTIVLKTTGSYTFHDHEDDTHVRGDFSVR